MLSMGAGRATHTSLARSGASGYHATTGPGAHRSGRPGKSGAPVGGPGTFKWQSEPGRSQGGNRPVAVGGRRDCRPWAVPPVTRTIIGPVRVTGCGWTRGRTAAITTPSGRSPDAGWALSGVLVAYSRCGGTPASHAPKGNLAGTTNAEPRRASLSPDRTIVRAAG